MNLLSIQTGDWYDELFGGDENPEAAFSFIKDCGFDALDYNLDHVLRPTRIEARWKNPLFDRSVEEILEHYRPVREGFLSGLRDIGYKGTLNFEIFAQILAKSLQKTHFSEKLQIIG